MGGGGSAPRRVSFEADENDNITVVKGVRVRLERAGREEKVKAPLPLGTSRREAARGLG